MNKIAILSLLGILTLATGCEMGNNKDSNMMQERSSKSYWQDDEKKSERRNEDMRTTTPAPKMNRRNGNSCGCCGCGV